MNKPIRIKRSKFETAGGRIITIALGYVEFPDGTFCVFNVRLQAEQGSEGGIRLIAEDVNKDNGGVSNRKLRRAN